VPYLLTFKIGGSLQRLFSMFPSGWPGRGLLLLRIVAAVLLIYDGIAGLMGVPQRESLTLEVVAASAGIFLLVGLWTPIAGAVVAVTELWIAVSGTDHVRGAIMLATTGVVMAVLGPGARSVDALLFGRKRLDI
jgi:putative oxidoreductase